MANVQEVLFFFFSFTKYANSNNKYPLYPTPSCQQRHLSHFETHVNNFPQYATYFCFTTQSTADGRHSNIEKPYKKRCTCSQTWTTFCKYSVEVTPKLPTLILTYIKGVLGYFYWSTNLVHKSGSMYGSLVLKWSLLILLH